MPLNLSSYKPAKECPNCHIPIKLIGQNQALETYICRKCGREITYMKSD